MAFFKFPKGQDDGSAVETPPAQSLEVLRRRAKYRLTGAAVLVLVGVIGLPLLLDRQPRPIAVDTPIEIPDRDKALPLPMTPVPAQKMPTEPVSAAPATGPAPGAATPSPESKVAGTPKGSDTKANYSKPAEPAPVAVVPPSVSKEANRAERILDGKAAAPEPAAKDKAVQDSTAAKTESTAAHEAANGARFVVQVGAFAENTRAREVRLKVEKTGLKTYTQVAETPDGRRIRVRVGPFASRAEAEKAAAKIKKLNLPAALLTL